MAKNQKNNKNTTNISNISNDSSVDQTPAENAAIEPIVEPAIEPTPAAESKPVKSKNAVKPVIAEPKFVTVKPNSIQETFEEAISITPYSIFQNGVLLCHYTEGLKIKTEAKYFEIQFKMYSYAGIEVKHK